jgi:hypothetical protein
MSRHISKRATSTGSQFGGVDNIIQPFPHEPINMETCTLIKATNPSANFPAGMNPQVEPIPITKKISS